MSVTGKTAASSLDLRVCFATTTISNCGSVFGQRVTAKQTPSWIVSLASQSEIATLMLTRNFRVRTLFVKKQTERVSKSASPFRERVCECRARRVLLRRGLRSGSLSNPRNFRGYDLTEKPRIKPLGFFRCFPMVLAIPTLPTAKQRALALRPRIAVQRPHHANSSATLRFSV